MWIRTETPADVAAIETVVRDAFATQNHSEQTEHRIIAALREAGALSLSLVAEVDGRIIGHVAFSPVTIGQGKRDWYGLGPVAVSPGHQGRGTGAALIRAGLRELQDMGAAGCVVLGEPKYYERFGFRGHPALTYPRVPAEYFMALGFSDAMPQGEVVYHPAFSVT